MADLSAMQAAVSQGNAARAQGDYKSAVTHYRAAGTLGASVVGPAIDASVPTGETKSLTQRAWDMNGLLSTIDLNTSVDSSQADAAYGWITQMMQWYVAANAFAKNPAAHADATTQMGKFVPISGILAQFADVPTFVAQMPAPTAPPPPMPVAPRSAAPVYVAPRPAPAPLRMAVALPPKKSPFTLKSALVAVGGGIGGALVGGPIGALAGAVLGGAGSKLVLKW